VYPKLYLGSGSMYDSRGWAVLVQVWELTVWNSVLDVDLWGPILLPTAICAWIVWRLWRRFGLPRLRRSKKTRTVVSGTQDVRDLDV